jgi:cytochrome c peroxidase
MMQRSDDEIKKNQYILPCSIANMFFVFAMLFFTQCSIDHEITDETFFHISIPAGFTYPEIPSNNPLTAEKIALGKQLFFDPVLSLDSSISCASCHKPAFAFSDNVAFSSGVESRPGFRNAPSLANVAYVPIMLRDGGFPSLETQVMVPVQDHNEMAFNMLELAQRLQHDTYYNAAFNRVFGRDVDAGDIAKAIAAFERTLLSGDAKYDKVMRKEAGYTFTPSEQAGYNLFFHDERLQCKSCHGGFTFTNSDFYNNGLYEQYVTDEGRARITGLSEDVGKFKVPTLRNISLTAPYMHDGSMPTLDAVITFYISGGNEHMNKSDLIKPISLSDEEKQNLIAFLHTLTDDTFITNPEWINH